MQGWSTNCQLVSSTSYFTRSAPASVGCVYLLVATCLDPNPTFTAWVAHNIRCCLPPALVPSLYPTLTTMAARSLVCTGRAPPLLNTPRAFPTVAWKREGLAFFHSIPPVARTASAGAYPRLPSASEADHPVHCTWNATTCAAAGFSLLPHEPQRAMATPNPMIITH